MKKHIKIFTTVLGFACSLSLSAQETITLDPALLEPSPTGYYIAGTDADLNMDGEMEHYNLCFDAYESDASHQESGTQQGFKYYNGMIMPTCGTKGTALDPPVATGFIQLNWSYNVGTDSAKLAYIITPAISNLEGMYMETSSDVSVNSKRTIPYVIEYSKDFGKTWEENFFTDHVATEGGYKVTYASGSGLYAAFDSMVEASKTSPIVIRISTKDHLKPGTENGQYVNIHKLVITGTKAAIPDGIKPVAVRNIGVVVNGNTIMAKHGSITVYDFYGRKLRKGASVTVPAGAYIVKTEKGEIQKIMIK